MLILIDKFPFTRKQITALMFLFIRGNIALLRKKVYTTSTERKKFTQLNRQFTIAALNF